jgi:hypothetical protein
MFVQTVLPVMDEAHFAAVKASLEPLFASGNVAGYLKRVQRAKLRVRDFEGLCSADCWVQPPPRLTRNWAILTVVRRANSTSRSWSTSRWNCEAGS